MSVFVKRALQMPSGVTYESGMSHRERMAIFENAKLDAVEMLAAEGWDSERIARRLSVKPAWVDAVRMLPGRP